VRRCRRISPLELRARLEELRRRAAFLSGHARLGRELREIFAAHGVPAWPPAADLSFRRWTCAHGCEEARLLLAELDELIGERWAEIEARSERQSGPRGPG
jgi:hypothetical protein